jgi:3-phenylpropionate/cinnamic acid dioxygenase small subunit
MVRSNFVIHEFRGGETRHLAGWYGHQLVRSGKDWLIRVKQVTLLECDQNIRNPSIIF